MNIQNAFSTPIGTFQLTNSETLNKGLTDLLLNIKKEDNHQRSMVGGYHTKEDLLTVDNILSLLVNMISAHIFTSLLASLAKSLKPPPVYESKLSIILFLDMISTSMKESI